MNELRIFYFILLIFSSFPKFSSLIEGDDIEREDTIYLTSNINEVFASTECTQYFINPLNKTIELIISFPIKKEINLLKFIISIGDKTVISKVLSKEKAEEKYDNSIYSGNTGFISEYDEELSNYKVNIGNIEQKQKIKLKTFFIQNIGSQDMSYEFVIMEKYPTFHYKELNMEKPRNKIIKANFIIETQSKITRLIAPFFDEKAKKNSVYEVLFSDDYKKANINYIKNPDEQKNIDIPKPGVESGFPGLVNQPTFLTSFSILFRVENMYKPILYYQFNPEFNESSYSINYVYSSENLKNIPIPDIPDQDNKISYYSKYEDNIINETPGLFIFLVDQSGSMYGKSIELVKEALLLFIQSLPSDSYFQLIGFGTTFKKYNEEPVEYNQKNVANIINIINNLNADMGGTNINSPLKDIYNNINYSKINLSKNIFLLTDGQINDRDECVELITANSNKFRIHSLGIGDRFDEIFIERSGKLGKGSFLFVKNVEEINSAVINTLNKCLRNYLIDINYTFINYKNNLNNNIISCNPMDNFAYQDEIINFSFILNEKNKIDIDELSEPIQIEIIGKNQKNIVKQSVSFDKRNIIKLPNGDELSKMIIGKSLKNNKELIDDKKKEVEFSKKYQILSKNTALFAEIIKENNNGEQNKLIVVDLSNYMKEEPIFKPLIFGKMPQLNSFSLGASLLQTESCEDNKADPNNIKFNIEASNEKNENTNEIKDNIIKLIMTQNVKEGYWDENEETKKLINNIDQDIFNKIINKIKTLNKGEMENKIKYTILVIYYLNNKYSDKINDYRLIINKAIKFLMKQGIKYEDFIKEI